jgi:DNA-binding PadR family transcriptional regulator
VTLSPAQIADRALEEIFNQRDLALMCAAIDELCAPELAFIDPEGTSHGIDEFVNKVIAAQALGAPDFRFTSLAPAHEVADLALHRWALGIPAQSPAVTGTDVVIIADGKGAGVIIDMRLAHGNIPSYGCTMPSRPVGRLLDLEYDILEAAIAMSSSSEQVYGFALARRLSATAPSSGLVGHGTLYKALGRLTEMDFLQSSWESAEEPGRPRRRLYSVTSGGQTALAARPASAPATASTKASFA